jgi:hypothetical protein
MSPYILFPDAPADDYLNCSTENLRKIS